MILMPVEPHTFHQILHLNPNDILDLVDTVGVATSLNPNLILSPKEKIMIACVMLNYANIMLEQCGSKVKTVINNPDWTEPATYQTSVNDSENPLNDLETFDG